MKNALWLGVLCDSPAGGARAAGAAHRAYRSRRSTGPRKRSTMAQGNWISWLCSTLIASIPICFFCIAASSSRRAESARTSTISARRCSSSSTARRSSRSTAGRPLLKGPAGAPCRMGHSHAIYNPTDKPVQWMNINVSAMKGTYDAFNLGDPRVDVPLDPIPVFMTMRLDRALLRPVNGMSGGQGRGAISARAGYFCVHRSVGICGSPGASARRVEPGRTCIARWREFYYVMNGDGAVTVAAETAPIRAGDAIPIQLSETPFRSRTPGPSLWNS